MSQEQATIYRDESGAEVNIEEFKRIMSQNHLQMRMEWGDRPDSRVQIEAIQRNFVGPGHLRPVLLELYKTDEYGETIGQPIIEWMTNYPVMICRDLMRGVVEGVWAPELQKFATVINPHPQY